MQENRGRKENQMTLESYIRTTLLLLPILQPNKYTITKGKKAKGSNNEKDS